MPSSKRLTQQIGGIALISGTFGIFAVASLLIFYTLLSLRAARDGWGAIAGAGYPYGLINDILTLLAALATFVLVVLIPRIIHKKDRVFNQLGTVLGIIGSLGIVLVMTAFLLEKISLAQQAAFYAIAFGPLGVWHISLNTSGNVQIIIPKGLAQMGIVVGVGEVVASLSFVAFNGFNIMDTADYQSLMTNYPLMIGTTVGGFLGYLGGPIWSVVLGKRLLA